MISSGTFAGGSAGALRATESMRGSRLARWYLPALSEGGPTSGLPNARVASPRSSGRVWGECPSLAGG